MRTQRMALLAGALLLTTYGASAAEIDLTTAGTTLQTLTAGYGANGLVGNFTSHPTGTGVYDPFLTVERSASGGNSGNIERGYNTDGVLYLDQQRPTWNTLLRFGQLARVNVNGANYYAFELDANEPSGSDKNLISVDNIRIYTSTTDNTSSVQNNENKLGQLGTLRWAMNDPLVGNGQNYNVNNWIKLDAETSNHLGGNGNGGSGYSDMIVYIPETAFNGVGANDYVWFYNLNGVHYTADADLSAQAGYEEWRAVVGANSVPDGGSTLALLGIGMVGTALLRRKLAK